MLFTTPTQWAALALALVAGWLLGLASHPGGKKWKTRYLAERDAHAELRRTQGTRVAELERENARIAQLERDNARLADLERDHARVAELERENERLRAAVPMTPAAPATSSLDRPFPTDRAAAAYPGDRRPI